MKNLGTILVCPYTYKNLTKNLTEKPNLFCIALNALHYTMYACAHNYYYGYIQHIHSIRHIVHAYAYVLYESLRGYYVFRVRRTSATFHESCG